MTEKTEKVLKKKKPEVKKAKIVKDKVKTEKVKVNKKSITEETGKVLEQPEDKYILIIFCS